ncbi:carbamoyltransferase HypF [Geovibrio thiophilus]|uniref:Carbamoyltransferase n=1 Tax=Geovibrio thiophilus TaxID=139438 RepID=A0A410JVV4_9BACT|nr:carbamoyltransferase HypF [Geovibrio thiophilus]QAR32293.1 carbamoyltransferase HypF [Geovibrio thiophilus]
MTKTYIIRIKGIVQGVGFRPFVYNLAAERGLKGYVLNDSKGVQIGLECSYDAARSFAEDVRRLAPPLSHIISTEITEGSESAFKGFEIRESVDTDGLTLVSPDVALCPDCRRELFDTSDRRFNYPFINCTNCGPRYSIIKSIPYDRRMTTMSAFDMCADCASEYKNPADRRFHAQPDCCPVCGPQAYGFGLEGDAALNRAADAVNSGEILAMKGLGGYHLICDALNEAAVGKLRELKRRGEKPFAVMCADVQTLEKYRTLSDTERNIIASPQAPILLLDWENPPFPDSVNPMGSNIGVMTAYTPLHALLMSRLNTDFIIATSGNLRDEPICIDEADAQQRLKYYTDNFLHHNRDIHNRVDDSVVAVAGGFPYVLRRARGFAPYPVMLPFEADKQVAGAGAHLKNGICFASGAYAFPSQYIGDLDNPETRDFYTETWGKMKNLLGIEPQTVITDIHPDYFSTRYAAETGAEVVTLQHHLAHFYAVLGENGHKGDALGLILDGTGLGTDGRIWGGELFVRKDQYVTRAARLPYILQPAMDTAAKKPAMMLVSVMKSYGLEKYADFLYGRFPEMRAALRLTEKMVETGFNSIETSSTGRLFEAAGALVSGIAENDFEAHLAIKLEYMADKTVTDSYHTEPMNPAGLFDGLFSDLASGTDSAVCSARFHNGFARMLTAACIKYAAGIKTVALSGGVFQNMLLLDRVTTLLRQNGFTPLIHGRIPANDGCISLGQVCGYVYGDDIKL